MIGVDGMDGPGEARRTRTRAPDGGRAWGSWSADQENAFLRLLKRLGTVEAAARALGYASATAYRHRRLRPAFAARWLALTGQAPGDLGRTGGTGESIVRYARTGRNARRPSRAMRMRCKTQWSDERETAFLDALAATCNVGASAEAAGVGKTCVYRQRRLRADFAAKWQAALEQGYARLEIALVRAAGDAMEGLAFDAECPVAPMTAETALRVLQAHRAAVTGRGRSAGTPARLPTMEEVHDEILRKAAAIRAARALPPGPPA